MPHRPGLDDHAELTRLLSLWANTREDLEGQLLRVLAEVEDLTRRDLNPIRRRRLRILARDLDDLAGVAQDMVDGLAQSTRAWLGQPYLGEIYAAGGALVPGFTFSATHQAAVDVIAQDLMGRALGRTSFVEAEAKRWVRRVSREMVGYQATQGQPAATVSRRFVKRLRAEFTARGIVGVTYRDGSRHSFMEYGEMLIRTQSGKAYNIGTLNAGRQAGIEFYEILDGSQCGLTGHRSTPLANGLIVPMQVALDWPLSHPNCRRSINPRPDIRTPGQADVTSVQAPDSRLDQATFERALARQTQRQRRRRFRPAA